MIIYELLNSFLEMNGKQLFCLCLVVHYVIGCTIQMKLFIFIELKLSNNWNEMRLHYATPGLVTFTLFND